MPILFVAITAMLIQQTVATTAKVGIPSLIPAVARELHFDADCHPRFYLMRITRRPPVLAAMTSHQRVSQCLGSADAQEWWLAVAPPGPPRADGSIASDQVLLVKLLPGEGVKLHPGTWHAGPFLNAASALFSISNCGPPMKMTTTAGRWTSHAPWL